MGGLLRGAAGDVDPLTTRQDGVGCQRAGLAGVFPAVSFFEGEEKSESPAGRFPQRELTEPVHHPMPEERGDSATRLKFNIGRRFTL